MSIDFNKMRVYGKSLRVRRLDDGNTEWVWYCTLRRKWNKYGDKVLLFFLCKILKVAHSNILIRLDIFFVDLLN